MSKLLDAPPFAPRDDDAFLAEVVELTRFHLRGCEPYRRVWPDWSGAERLEDVPFLHVGVFKHVLFRTQDEGIEHQRTLVSSSTTGAIPSRIVLDQRSSLLQGRSSRAILEDAVGSRQRPLLVIDSARSLRSADVAARVAAAMSLKPLASSIHFLLEDPEDPASVAWDRLRCVLREHDDLLVYGFTWILWLAWANGEVPDDVRELLRGKRVCFVHSGGWKRLAALQVERAAFDAKLLAGLAEGSLVVDYYGLVEQVGIVYPLCSCGARHVPRWAAVLVRAPSDLHPLADEPGLLQLVNVLAHGAPYHSVLTEDTGRLVPGPCPRGRQGQRFELIGRLPKAELRGCANV